MKKLIFTSLFSMCSVFASLHGQVTNFALKLDGTDKLTSGVIRELAGSNAYCLQMYIAPSEWTPNAYLFKQGEGAKEFSAKLSAVSGNIIFKVGNQEITAANVPASGWSQLTFSVFQNGIDIWVNEKKTWVANTNLIMPEITTSLVIGQNFKGRIDEFRIWNTEMPSASTENLMFKNTVNKFHPQWDNLIVYYKFDQDQCLTNVVDYKLNHHGSMASTIKREAVRDNANLKYRTVSGYSSFIRHSDRLQIDKDMHILTNDLIMLDANVNGFTGEVSLNYPEFEGKIAGGAKHLASFGGRNGVLSFDGTGSMNVGTGLFRTGITSSDNGSATLAGWFNIGEWKEGAKLFEKKENDNNYIRIYLGTEANKELVVEINKSKTSFQNVLQGTAVWQHLAISIDPNTSRKNRRVLLTVNNVAAPLVIPTGETDNAISIVDIKADAIFGENFIGKMDELLVWRGIRTSFANEMNGTSQGLKFPAGGQDAITLDCYWQFDDAANLGMNTKGWKNLVRKIKENYKDYRGFKVRFGLITSETDASGNKAWTSNIVRKKWRDKLISDVKELLPYCDGIDVDFEWLYAGDSKWSAYGELVQGLRDIIPTDKVFSVSLHPVSYWVPKDKIPLIDFVTFQNYGPKKTQFYPQQYKASYTMFKNWGYSDEQIRLSIPTTATDDKLVRGYKDLVNQITPYDPSINTVGDYLFNGVNQVKEKQQFLVDNNCGGTMYFDMGNDVSASDERSLIRAINMVIGSNVDLLIKDINDIPSGIETETAEKKTKLVNVYPNPAKDYVIVENFMNGNENIFYELYSMAGTKIWSNRSVENKIEIDTANLLEGIYFLRTNTASWSTTNKVYIQNN